MIAAKGQAIRGVGQHYFCERLPNLRIATDDGQPAHLRRLSGIVSPELAGELRCLRRAVGRARGERRGICDLPAVPGRDTCVQAGTPLWPVGRRLVRAILLLNYARIEPPGRWFAERLLEVIRADEKRLWGDMVVPMPLHRQRKKERGFNQVELFARPLARRLGIAHRPVLLMRTRPRPEKHLLDYEERWESVHGAFALKEGRQVDNCRILLLDDGMTTGATLDACSRALANAGASSVIALTVARAVRPASPAGR